jgi:hypothetical protein
VFMKSTILFAAAPILTLAASPALAHKADKHHHGAPGPIAGAGLGYLVLPGGVVSGYYLYRRRKQDNGR